MIRYPIVHRRMLAAVVGGGLLFGLSSRAVDTAPPIDPEPPPVVVPAGESHPLQDTVAETLDLLEANGLSYDEAEARRSLIKALALSADPYAQLLTEDEHRRLAESAEGAAYDTGIHFVQSNRYAVVIEVEAASPAAEAGIRVGDYLANIGDTPASTLDVAQIQQRLRGMEPGEVTLTVQHGEEDPVEHTLDQRRVTLRSVEESTRLPAGLGYVRINGLFPDAGTQVADILTGWGDTHVDGVVLDLRGANGGDLGSVVTIAGLMSEPDSLLFSYRNANDEDLEVHHSGNATRLGVPLMLLVDQQTSGASELLAAVLSGSGRGAMLIGTPTAGDPLIRDRIPLADGYVLYIASRRLVVADGETYAGKETVRPDILINPNAIYPDFDPVAPLLTDPRGVTEQELETHALRAYINGDIPMTRAVDVLLGLKALNLHSFDYEGPRRP